MDVPPTTESESALGQLKAFLVEADEDMELKKFRRFGNTDQIFDEVQRRVRVRQDQQ
jgi:hypothetical protein